MQAIIGEFWPSSEHIFTFGKILVGTLFVWTIGLLPLWKITDYQRKFGGSEKSKNSEKNNKEKVEPYDLNKIYDMSIKQEDEVDVAIKEIWIYPIRGARGIKVDQVELTRGGIKGDRSWVVYDFETNAQSSSTHTERFSDFELEFLPGDKSKLKFSLRNDTLYPHLTKRYHILDYNKDYKGAKYNEHWYWDKKVNGYQESEELDRWLSQIFGKPVTMVRSLDQEYKINPVFHVSTSQRLETDRVTGFKTIAALHLINLKSYEHVHQKVLEKYKNEPDLL